MLGQKFTKNIEKVEPKFKFVSDFFVRLLNNDYNI